jgi:hypothetical protein
LEKKPRRSDVFSFLEEKMKKEQKRVAIVDGVGKE